MWGGAGMGFSPCLPCNKDLGEPWWQISAHAAIRHSMQVLQDAQALRRGCERSEAASPWWEPSCSMVAQASANAVMVLGMEVLQDAQGEAASEANYDKINLWMFFWEDLH